MGMFVENLSISGLKVVEPRIFRDERGAFWESYRQPLYLESGIAATFVQDNCSFSRRHTIRGLHHQQGQSKLVSVIHGTIWDVAIDIRPDSPTFGKYAAVELDGETRRQLFIPAGFAHGFCVLSETALVQYKVSEVYNPSLEGSIRWNDPEIGIDWPCTEPILSERDRTSPFLHQRKFL